MLAGLPFLTVPTLLARLRLPGRPVLTLLTGGLSSLALPGGLAALLAGRGGGPLLVLSLRRRAGLSPVLSALALFTSTLTASKPFTSVLSAPVLSTLLSLLLSAATLPSLSVLILVHAGALWERTRVAGENTGVR